MLKDIYSIEDPEIVNIIYEKLYDTFIKMVDAKDNGIFFMQGIEMFESHSEERYRDSTGLNSRIARLNPGWNEKVDP
jgi:uncharacterized UPF0160 family protein